VAANKEIVYGLGQNEVERLIDLLISIHIDRQIPVVEGIIRDYLARDKRGTKVDAECFISGLIDPREIEQYPGRRIPRMHKSDCRTVHHLQGRPLGGAKG